MTDEQDEPELNVPLIETTEDDDDAVVEEEDYYTNHDAQRPHRRTCWKLCGQSLCSRVRHSLAWAPSTSSLATVLIPLFAIANHVLFYYGQTAPMWRLELSSHVDVWVNASSLEARTTFYTLGFDRDLHYSIDQDESIRDFTYAYAIQELWAAVGMPGKLLPRIAAVLLIIFSGVWPHLKLMCLIMTWFFMTGMRRRKRTLHWLSTLGKWSLADVLVVCVMVGVLNLDWQVDPTLIKEGFVEQMPLLLRLMQHIYTPDDACSMLLHVDCVAPPSRWSWTKCASCRNFVSECFEHPQASKSTFGSIASGVDESGGGLVELRVEGMSGIYAFCMAVVMSIALSLAVDVYDVRARRMYSSEVDDQDEEGALLLDEEQPPAPLQPAMEDTEAAANAEPEQVVPLETASSDYNGLPPIPRWQHCTYLVLSLFTLGLVLAAIFGNTLQRRVHGAIPQLLGDVLGIAWDRDFSLWSLAKVTGAAGGWDWLLRGTFTLFLVLGPALRAAMIVAALVLPRSDSIHRVRFLTAIEFLGAFCAWEVIALASYLVSLLIPSTTDTILNRPECKEVSPDGSCLEVFFDPQDDFVYVILGGILLVIVARLPASMMNYHW